MKVMSTPNFLPLMTLTPLVLSLYALVRLPLRPSKALMKADLPVPVMPTTIIFTLRPSLGGEGGSREGCQGGGGVSDNANDAGNAGKGRSSSKQVPAQQQQRRE